MDCPAASRLNSRDNIIEESTELSECADYGEAAPGPVAGSF